MAGWKCFENSKPNNQYYKLTSIQQLPLPLKNVHLYKNA